MSTEAENSAGGAARRVDDSTTALGHDDYSLTRVPRSARYSWVTVAVQRFGQLSALGNFFLAAMIGMGMDFWSAILAITIGSVLLEGVTIFLGIAGMREGLSTSVLARWTGFGAKGSALVGVAMAVSLTGWFAVQNEVFAQGLFSIIPQVPLWAWCLVGGALVTIITARGFNFMKWVAYVTVPAFLIVTLWAFAVEVSKYSLATLVNSPPPGTPISLAVGTTIVAGGFIVGAIFTPDMARFNRNRRDVVLQTVIGVTLGEYVVGVIGVLLAHAVKVATEDSAGQVVAIIQSSSGILGVIVLVASILKVNDWNLYPSSLGISNAVEVFFRRRVNRATVAVVLGAVGSVLSAFGFANQFQGFLTELGILFPPIAAIIIADYYVLKTWRPELDESRERGALPDKVVSWVPAGLVAWAVGYLVGKFVTFGVPSINSLVIAFLVYLLLGKLGLAGKPRASRRA
ncbi:cytosine permease [Leucobacter sp. wl10]|uniref:purine-cytosine permease family protein n=1 Tax=Leucobacter sp. wl10 TaxID=2304677 RepID=UPI000E5BD1F0|nr:cytosine permease [Leucobacter sp. wl10]RGE19293.1 cytosine permease [Leucobacter sp. wl10]